jgi:hypothetical protein
MSTSKEHLSQGQMWIMTGCMVALFPLFVVVVAERENMVRGKHYVADPKNKGSSSEE